MASQGGPRPTTPTGGGIHDDGEPVSAVNDLLMAGYSIDDIFADLPVPGKLTGEIWNLKFQCVGATYENEIVEIDIDRAFITFYNMMYLKSKLRYSGRDFVFYKKRSGNDRATLEALDFTNQIGPMVLGNAGERAIRFVLTKDQPKALEVSITPMKRPRQQPNIHESISEVPIDSYKDWLVTIKQDHPETDLMDDFRDETVKTYKEWLRLRQQGDLPDIISYMDHHSNDEENHGSSGQPTDWPSHARRHRKKHPASDECFKKDGRGPLRGIAAATKRFKSGDQKLSIEFSSRLGGPIGPNARTFVDEVVLFTKKRAPLIGVKKWRDIVFDVRLSISSNILQRWDFPGISNEDAREKIWKIAKERYKGWRSALSSTYKAYTTYAERMKNKPEEVDIVEWHYLMLYFGSKKFQEISTNNSWNRKQQKTKHTMGSKTFSQICYEQRDPETGEEPSDLTIWMRTHMKNGLWSDDASKAVFDNACQKIAERESQGEASSLTREEENNAFQSSFKETIGCKGNNRLHGHGYLSKYPTRNHIMNSKLLEQARATARTDQKNIELEGQVQLLEDKLAKEVADRERILQDQERIMQEKLQHLQEEEDRKREALKEEMMKEMFAALAGQRNATVQQTNLETVVPIDTPVTALSGANNVRTTRSSNRNGLSQSNKGNGLGTFISPHNLRNAVTRRVHARNEQNDLPLGSDLQG